MRRGWSARSSEMAAETVLSMARSMLGSVITKAAAAASEEMSLLMGVQKEIWFMKDELETMQAFLVAPEVTKKKDKLVKVWAKQVRDLSYDIEDCLDEFTVHVGSQSLSQQVMKLKDRHRIAVQIRNLKARVEEVSNRNTHYNLIRSQASNTMNETESYMEDIHNHPATNIDEAQLVGFDEPKRKLLEMICADEGHARVISVVGMGGLGKTTLARKIYASMEDVTKNFSCFAWITVSQSFSKTELLQSMIKQLLGDESLKQCLKQPEGNALSAPDNLASHLTKKLQDKRYFIILDDLWTIEAWNSINGTAFQSTNNNGSRIIVTTRDADLARICTSDESFIYYLKPLEIDDAIKLLLRKAKKQDKDIENKQHLKEIVTQMANKCGRLPLVIVTIGGIIASKKIEEWEKFSKQLPSELENNPGLEPVRRIVTLSYNHLPSHLKPCFLYLSIFPEDIEIKRRRLVERWIAEGLVTAKVGITDEEVGESYFQELISRSMILPARINIEGVVKSCRVHDIVRDTIVSISREENFVYSTEDNVHRVVVGEKFLHVAYHGKSCTNLQMDWSCVRSVSTFGERPTKPSPSLCSPELRMLRTLDVKDAQFKIAQKDINNIGLLRHLKYVNAQYDGPSHHHSNIYALPRSIGKLQSLQVLDLRGSCITELASEVTKLQSLRSLRCSKHTHTEPGSPAEQWKTRLHLMFTSPVDVDSEDHNEKIAQAHLVCSSPLSYARVPGVQVPRGIGNLKALQILEVVDLRVTSTKAIQELGELSQLRKLKVTTKGAEEGKCKAFCKALEKLTSLRSVCVDGKCDYPGGTLEWLGSTNDLCPPPLRSLTLIGKMDKMGTTPAWFARLTQLVKVYLKWTLLKDLKILGDLPNLMLLQLFQGAYVEKKLTFSAQAFPSLKKLVISLFYRKMRTEYLGKIKEMTFEGLTFDKDASPRLECIQIEWMKLKSGITGIDHLPRLKEISLGYRGQVAGLETLQTEVDEHPNKPVLRLEGDKRDHDLRNVEEEATKPHQPDDAEREHSQVTTRTDDREIQSIPSRCCLLVPDVSA